MGEFLDDVVSRALLSPGFGGETFLDFIGYREI
jgi:hypothetical protein